MIWFTRSEEMLSMNFNFAKIHSVYEICDFLTEVYIFLYLLFIKIPYYKNKFFYHKCTKQKTS